MDGGCRFCEIVAGKAPAYIISKDKQFTAFLDAIPIFSGHSLIVTNKHYETIEDTPPKVVGDLFRLARMLSVAVRETTSSQGTLLMVNNKVSQSIPHIHVHVIPRNKGDGMVGFMWPRHPYQDVKSAENVRIAIAAVMKKLAMGKNAR